MSFALALFALLVSVLPGVAQDWPTRTVRIIVPFGAGSTPDLVARMIADQLQQKLGGLDHRFRVKPFAHRSVMHDIGDAQDGLFEPFAARDENSCGYADEHRD